MSGILQPVMGELSRFCTTTGLLLTLVKLRTAGARNVVDVHVGNLRRKLSEAAEEQLLTTVRGVGFSLRRGGDAV